MIIGFTVAGHVQCNDCGHDLFQALVRSKCSECGLEVTHSMRQFYEDVKRKSVSLQPLFSDVAKVVDRVKESVPDKSGERFIVDTLKLLWTDNPERPLKAKEICEGVIRHAESFLPDREEAIACLHEWGVDSGQGIANVLIALRDNNRLRVSPDFHADEYRDLLDLNELFHERD